MRAVSGSTASEPRSRQKEREVWEKTTLREVTRHHSGNSKLIKGKLFSSPEDGLFPAYSASGQDVWRDAFEHEGDAVVVSAVGARCGKCFLASGKWSAIANTHVVWPNSESIDIKFLWYRINDERFWERSGSAQPFVVVRKTFEREFHLPPLAAQQRIVAEIEKQFTRLEAGLAGLRRVQANLKRYRAAVLKAACEGKLVPNEVELAKAEGRKVETGAELLERILAERRAIHEKAQAKASRKKKYKEPIDPTVPPGDQLPEGWVWATWDQVGFSQNGRPFQSAEYQPTGSKLLRPGNLHMSGKVLWNHSNTRCLPPQRARENADLIVRGSELVMNLTAQSLKDEFLGRVCITAPDEECLLNQRLARLTPLIILPHFALYLLKASRFRRFVDGLNSGSLIQHMFTSQLATFTFPLPPLAEQKRIVAEVERRLSVIDELEAVVAANLQRATRLRQSILQRAFTGELV